MNHTITSLFSGCGGLDLGFHGNFEYLNQKFEKLNFETIFANDIDKNACITFSKNFNKAIEKDFQNRDYMVRFSIQEQKKYTKADCFVYMDCLNPKFFNAFQVEAGLLGFRKTDSNIKFITEWLDYAKDERILTDIPNQSYVKNSKSFIDHRHDQSILNNLLVKYDYLHHSDNLALFTSCNVENQDKQKLLWLLDNLEDPL